MSSFSISKQHFLKKKSFLLISTVAQSFPELLKLALCTQLLRKINRQKKKKKKIITVSENFA